MNRTTGTSKWNTAICCAIAWRLAAPAAFLQAAEYLATDQFKVVETLVADYVKRFGAEHVLFCTDIDNTLLAMNDELGSDQWFEWQDFLLRREPRSPHLVANSFAELLEVQGLLFTLGRMHPPEPVQPQVIERIQKMGVATLVITSRGHDFRAATERELNASGYDFGRSALIVTGMPAGAYQPYELANPQDAGLTADEVVRFGLKEPRPVSYERGILMVSGQHKGAMLLTMLQNSPRKIRAVLFVDDHGRHTGHVFSALASRGMEVTTVHYYHEDERVKSFAYGDKSAVTEQWRDLSDSVKVLVK